ncbi:hypothetical protein FRC04_008723 [Tulasnella sp. 424]|nr:hypothetical protein FRC04_008723 [Tulasnella sp. 424]
MESSSATSSSAPHRPASLLFDKVMPDVPPLPQLEHHQAEHGSPASTPSPVTASPTSIMLPDIVEDDAIVVDAGSDDDDHHDGSPVDDDALVLSPAALNTVFPTSPSLGEPAPASPIKTRRPSPSPLQRSLSQLSSLSLSTRSLTQSQHQQLLLSPSFSALQTPSLSLSPSRKSTAGSAPPSPTQSRPQLQPPAITSDTTPISTSLLVPPRHHTRSPPPSLSSPRDAIVGDRPKDQADEEEEKEVEEALNTTLTLSSAANTEEDLLKTSAGTAREVAAAVDRMADEEQKKENERKEMSTAKALATIRSDEGVVAEIPEGEKQEGGARTSKGTGKEKDKAGTSIAGSDTTRPSTSSPKPFRFNGSRLARKSAQHNNSRQSFASPDPFYNPNATTNVYINGLPPFFTHEQLTRLASEFGKVLSSRVFHRFSQIKPNGSGQQQGSTYAFVLYETIEDAQRCITSLRKYSDLHPSFARTQRLPSSRPQQPTTAEGLLDKNRPEYRGSPNTPDVNTQPPPHFFNKETGSKQHPPTNLPDPRHRPAKEEEVNVLIQGLPANTTPENVQALIGDRVVPLSINLLPIGTEQKREGRQIAYVRFGRRKDANDVISKLHMTRVLGFVNNDRSTVPPTLQVVEISPVPPHDSADVDTQASDLSYGSPSPPRRTIAGSGQDPRTSSEYRQAPLDPWGVPMHPVSAAQHVPAHRLRATSGTAGLPQQPYQQQGPSAFDAHPLLMSQLLPQPTLQLPAARSSAALLNQNQNQHQRFGPHQTQPGFANLGLGLPSQFQQLQHAMPFLPQDRNMLDMGTMGGHADLNAAAAAVVGSRRAVSMPFPQVPPPLPSAATAIWPPLSASVSAPQIRNKPPQSPPRTTAATGATIRPFVPGSATMGNLNFNTATATAPRNFSAGHLQVGQNSIPLTVNQQAAQAYSARFRQRVQQQQQQAPPELQHTSVRDTARDGGAETDFAGDLAPQGNRVQPPPPPAHNATPAPSRRRAFRRNAAANS